MTDRNDVEPEIGLKDRGKYRGWVMYENTQRVDGKLQSWWGVKTKPIREPGNYWPDVFFGAHDGSWPTRADAERWIDAVLIPSRARRAKRKDLA
jgi:hypothetical protein